MYLVLNIPPYFKIVIGNFPFGDYETRTKFLNSNFLQFDLFDLEAKNIYYFSRGCRPTPPKNSLTHHGNNRIFPKKHNLIG